MANPFLRERALQQRKELKSTQTELYLIDFNIRLALVAIILFRLASSR
jgi:hypothetical protein